MLDARKRCLHLEGFLDPADEVNCLRMTGGIQIGGTSTSLNKSAGFYRGNVVSVSHWSNTQWENNETCLMTVETKSRNDTCFYDVVLEVRTQPVSR